MDKLHFLTAGIPIVAKNYGNACNTLRELNLNGMELEFVHGVRMSEDIQNMLVKEKEGLIFTAHAPFYVNLNSKEEEKVVASINRILQTADVTNALGGYSIVYHAGFYQGMAKEKTFENILKAHETIVETLEANGNKIWIRPETTGKASQWGDVEEIVELSSKFNNVLPCVDFSHLHARYGGSHNTYDEFCSILDTIGNRLGSRAIENFHAHIAGIEYTAKGERKHLILEESDMNYKDLLKALKAFDVKGAVVCESPNIEGDAIILKEYYESLWFWLWTP